MVSSFPALAAARISLEVSPDSIRVGDPIELRLTYTPPGPGQIALPNLGEALEKFDLLAMPDSSAVIQASQGQAVTIPLRATCYRGGPQVIQPIQVIWTSPDGAIDSAETEPVIVNVQGVVPDSILAAADSAAKPFTLLQSNRTRRAGYGIWEFVPWFLGIAAAIGAFLLLRRWLERRKARRLASQVEPAVPARPAHEVALEALDRLRDRQIWQDGRIKQYYSELSEIVRRYTEDRFQIPALESTSFQLLRDLERKVSDANLRSVLQSLLEDADLAKFAKHQPDGDTCQRDLERGYVFVRKTIPAAPVAESTGEAA